MDNIGTKINEKEKEGNVHNRNFQLYEKIIVKKINWLDTWDNFFIFIRFIFYFALFEFFY